MNTGVLMRALIAADLDLSKVPNVDFGWAVHRNAELILAGGSEKRSAEQTVFELKKRIAAREADEARAHRERLAAEDADMRERMAHEHAAREEGRPTLTSNALGDALRKAGVV